MAFGVTRALVHGLMERPEVAGVVPSATGESPIEAAAPLAAERAAGWIERRAPPEDR